MCLHQILCYSGRKWSGNLQIAAGSLWGADRGAKTQIFELFSHFQSVLTSIEILSALYILWKVKQIECGSSEGGCPQKQE